MQRAEWQQVEWQRAEWQRKQVLVEWQRIENAAKAGASRVARVAASGPVSGGGGGDAARGVAGGQQPGGMQLCAVCLLE
jgi:hypothetical protein